MATRRWLLLVILVHFGCGPQANGPRTVESDKSTIVEPGQLLEDVLTQAKLLGMRSSEPNLAVAHQGDEPRKDILLGVWQDALFISATAPRNDGPSVIRGIYWWRNYAQDVELPKSERQGNIESVDRIDLGELVREHGVGAPTSASPRIMDENPFAE